MKNYKNYHNNTKFADKLIHDGIKTFKRSLKESPDSHRVNVNNRNTNILVQSTANYNERRIIFSINDIEWGDIVVLNNDKWLVTERPFSNNIYEKSHMVLCNNVMTFETKTNGHYKETDRFGNPIWIEEPKIKNIYFPCVVESMSKLQTEIGNKINMSEGEMSIQIPYTTDNLISNQSEFKIFNDDDYRIIGIDKSKTYNDKGILILIVKKITT